MPRFCLNPDANRAQILANLIGFINRLPADKPWQVEIEPLRKERSGNQNRALFGVAYADLRDQTGSDKNDLHDYFCREYFGEVEKRVMGKALKVATRTTTTGYDGEHDVIEPQEFAKFYEFVQQRAASMGYFVRDPDPLR